MSRFKLDSDLDGTQASVANTESESAADLLGLRGPPGRSEGAAQVAVTVSGTRTGAAASNVSQAH